MSLEKKQTKEEQLAKIFKALADENRLAILFRLQKEGHLNCSTLHATCDLTAPSVSHHLKILFECGLIDRKRDGQTFYNAINKELFEEVMKELKKFT